MSKSKAKVDSLLAAIHRKMPTQPAVPDAKPEDEAKPRPTRRVKGKAAETAAKPEIKPEGSELKAKRRVGKQVQFWFHDEDTRLVRELAAWIAGQGRRTSDSAVVKATLRMATTGTALLDAYDAAIKCDGRLKTTDRE